jgi:hypothetical protein
MRTIPLTQGKVALVDDEDFERINQHKWFAHKSPDGGGRFYALRNQKVRECVGKKRKTVAMHREVLQYGDADPDLDHRDRDGLNNQKSNLRAADDHTNQWNKMGWSKTGFKGVHFMGVRRLPYQARITSGGKQIHIGSYKTPTEAATAYNQKALQLFGEFARLNIV